MVIAPKQDRSRATLERLLEAASELLEEKSWEETTISEIVGRAGSSVGSFYARFPNKEALVAALLDRYGREVQASIEGARKAVELNPEPLAARARRLVSEIITLCRRRRGLLRLRMIRRLSETASPSTNEARNDLEAVEQLVRLFDSCRSEITHEDKDAALRFALRLVDGVAIAGIALDDISDSYGATRDEALIDSLTTTFVAYLTTPALRESGGPTG